jgi:hypothetical protein
MYKCYQKRKTCFSVYLQIIREAMLVTDIVHRKIEQEMHGSCTKNILFQSHVKESVAYAKPLSLNSHSSLFERK